MIVAHSELGAIQRHMSKYLHLLTHRCAIMFFNLSAFQSVTLLHAIFVVVSSVRVQCCPLFKKTTY